MRHIWLVSSCELHLANVARHVVVALFMSERKCQKFVLCRM